MKNNKQQTAVEWIEDNIQLDMTIMEVLGLIREAKEMEKEQIMDVYWDGGQDVPTHQNTVEEYYNKTYGGNK